MSDHRHESYDVYGLDGTSQDAREALALAAGLREDLGRAEERIRELEARQTATINALHQAFVGLYAQLAEAGVLRDDEDAEPEPGDYDPAPRWTTRAACPSTAITVQDTLVEQQATAAIIKQVACPHCGVPHRHKDTRTIMVRSLFGALRLASPRWWHCGCRDQPTRTFQPLAGLLPERTTPELAYLQARFAALVSLRHHRRAAR